nr:transformation/transcription domain-associated protein isoform X4 [Parasteatoda tepidariorum]
MSIKNGLFLESLSMARIPVMSVSASINDPVAVVNTYCSYVSMLKDPVAKDESKLKALPESSGELEQLRKTIVEIIHTLPANNHLLPDSKPILSLMFKSLEVENEENMLVVFRIIMEFHKTFRPP